MAIDKRTLGRWALTSVAGMTLGFILLPLVFVTWLAFFLQAIPSFPPQGYSLKWFYSIAENPRFVDGFVLSLQVAVVATIIGVAIGVPAALCLARYRFRGASRSATCCCCRSSFPASCWAPRCTCSMSRRRS